MLTEGVRNLEIIPSSGSWPIKLSVDLFMPFFWWVFKTRMWFILHCRPDDTQTVTNASKLTVLETASACQAVQNQCFCNQNTMDPTSPYRILMHVWLVHVNGKCMCPVCERPYDKWKVVCLWPLVRGVEMSWDPIDSRVIFFPTLFNFNDF